MMPKTYKEVMDELWELLGSCDEGVEVLEALQAAHEAALKETAAVAWARGYEQAEVDSLIP